MFATDPVPHEDAARFIADKPAVTKDVFKKLLPELQARAFTISGMTCADELRSVRDALATIPQGADWDEVKKDLIGKLTWLNPVAAEKRAETILRVQVYQSYAASNFQSLEASKDIFPFRQYLSAGDTKVRKTHEELNGIVLPADSPFWARHTPPWEWNCRCDVVGLTQGDVEDIKAADAKRLPEKKLVVEGVLKDKLEQGILVRGPTQIYDVRTPVERGKPGGYEWEPGTLNFTVEQLRDRYKKDPETWRVFEEWARKTQLPGEGDGTPPTVWEWIGGKPAAAAAPAEPTVAPAKGPPDPAKMREQLAALELERAKATTPEEYAAFIEKCRATVSLPADEQAALKLPKAGKSVAAAVAKGAEIVKRYVPAARHPTIPKITTSKSKKARAFYDPDTMGITISSTTSASTVAHEITHGVECQTPTILQKSRDFLAKRAGDEKPQKLKDLTGMNYKPHEIAYEDEWKKRGGSHYSGKLYGASPAVAYATELLSMGIERLHKDPSRFASEDPDYFDHVISSLQH